MVHRPYKFKLLLNEFYDLKHITGDLHKEGISDPEVYEIARKDKRLVVTYNEKDFRKLAIKCKESGVIGISGNMSVNQIDTKLSSLLRKSNQKDLFGKFTSLSNENSEYEPPQG